MYIHTYVSPRTIAFPWYLTYSDNRSRQRDHSVAHANVFRKRPDFYWFLLVRSAQQEQLTFSLSLCRFVSLSYGTDRREIIRINCCYHSTSHDTLPGKILQMRQLRILIQYILVFEHFFLHIQLELSLSLIFNIFLLI